MSVCSKIFVVSLAIAVVFISYTVSSGCDTIVQRQVIRQRVVRQPIRNTLRVITPPYKRVIVQRQSIYVQQQCVSPVIIEQYSAPSCNGQAFIRSY